MNQDQESLTPPAASASASANTSVSSTTPAQPSPVEAQELPWWKKILGLGHKPNPSTGGKKQKGRSHAKRPNKKNKTKKSKKTAKKH